MARAKECGRAVPLRFSGEQSDSRYGSGDWAPTADVHPDDKVVVSGQERVKLSISGMVNRAVNVVDDGKDTDAYFVDNDNAESRVTFVGKAKVCTLC